MVLKRLFFLNLKILKWSDFYELKIDGMVTKVSLFLKKTYMRMAPPSIVSEPTLDF